MATHRWYHQSKDYAKEKEKRQLSFEATSNHPLKAITVTEIKCSDKRGTPSRSNSIATGQKGLSEPLSLILDPLNAEFDGRDPLSMFAAEAEAENKNQKPSSLKERSISIRSGTEDDNFEPWCLKKAGILSKYTTSEKLSITTSFLSTSDKEKVIIKTQSTVTDKVKNRLEQLDDFEEGSVQEMLDLSQQEYVKRIDELNMALINAWDQDQRVKSLKIAIQCSKLLSDTSVIQFYPSKFVLVTDILDTFGKLVYDRLKEKAMVTSPGTQPVTLSENFSPSEVPDAAKEICYNWFYKIASIRELIPRFYVEVAILKCYNYLDTKEHGNSLKRLASMIRGIGDPLVAAYARCYLCRVGATVAFGYREHLLPCFDDFLFTYHQTQEDGVQNVLARQKLETPKYLTLYSPALDWLLQCLAHEATSETLEQILKKTSDHCNSALLLNSIISAFQPSYIANRASQFVEMIKNCEESGFPKHMLYRTLGACLILADPPANQRLSILNDVWKSIMKLKHPRDYISCAEVWIEYVAKHFGKREINTVLSDISKHMSPDRAYEDYYPQLQSVVSKVLIHFHNFSVLFGLDKFLPFLDMFQRESVKVEACKSIMEAFIKYQTEPTDDPVIINTMMFLCKVAHDSVNALTLEDEKRLISNLIIGFLRKVTFGQDFEQQLSFFVEARATFSNLDPVLVALIHSVNQLAMSTHKIVKGKHTKKTAAFVKACAAYCFITIPSLRFTYSQLSLYLVSGQVALLNQCLGQADEFFKAIVLLIPEIPRSLKIDNVVRQTEPLLVEFLSNFISTLLVVPDNPDAGVMYVLKGLLNVLKGYNTDANTDGKIVLYIRVLCMLSGSCQEDYLYHVSKVDSNDKLYGSDPIFIEEVRTICDSLITEILGHLKTLASQEAFKRQSYLALELFNTIVTHGQLTEANMLTLAVNLWGLSQKHGCMDKKQITQAQHYVQLKAKNNMANKGFTSLASKMSSEFQS
ncbi:VPS35 endosomal protein sorting factor-like [Octopus sinensis]|uniref:VPS35 endosomal protein sorting factor-like n=1 Tax=Octopus sinensis TaxID=2607531 RepID=A0A6P7T6Z2_9MOLL|nr:VPS35 endosomal protein sorting factor-like [Octopus sinensis]